MAPFLLLKYSDTNCHKTHSLGERVQGKGVNPQAVQRAVAGTCWMVPGSQEGTPDPGLPEGFQNRLKCAEVWRVSSNWLWEGKETKGTKIIQVPLVKVSLVL